MADYVKEMRKIIGHDPLMSVGVGVMIENAAGELLLQKRTDDGTWGTLGGGMNLGETIVETAKREVFEESGLVVDDLELFGIYSGEHCVTTYPNEDIVFGVIIMFTTRTYSGALLADPEESAELRFFARDALPDNLNRTSVKWIEQWKKGTAPVIVD